MTALEVDIVDAREGSAAAFTRLVESYANTVTAIALAIVRDFSAAQDIAQDVFLVVWRDLSKLRNPASFAPWVRQITRNRAQEWMRSRVRERSDEGTLLSVADVRLSPRENLEREEQQRIVDEVIEALPDEAREIITLYYREGRSVKQVADLLDLSEEVVKKRMSRARERIREDILERFGVAVKTAAPAARIVAAVAAAMAVSAPPAAAAASAIAGTKLAGKSVAATIAAGLGSAIFAAMLGSAGVLFGVRKNLQRAVDEQERKALRRFARCGVIICTVAAFGFALSGFLVSVPVLIANQLWFAVSLSVMYMRWLPRITARRRAAEVAADPSAAERYRRERVRSIAGLTFGLVVSTATVIWAAMLILSQRN